MQLHASRHQRLLQCLQIAQAVAIVEETRQAIVAALHDVLRNARQAEAGQASHQRKIACRSGLGARIGGIRRRLAGWMIDASENEPDPV
ncbi:hypothetical protein [Luteimonas sp. 3794]|uniref:hypothetical protein n=1 Tax=Luteimonas sp. 3794 TaxID=2817730 RepID=UPI0028573069|nr:hypothetical protein [Luteimonas sp. 3794]MDR6990661.1 hypothetical protein [Luteimonas sp. 3794]